MKKRSGNLDLLKFLFSLMILMFHGKNLATSENYIFPGGSIAVEFFFVVSGVLMAKAASSYVMQDNLGKDTFFYVIAPISALFLMGITYQNWKSFGGQSIWLGCISKGTVRAFMSILLGCVAYKISEYLKQKEFTNLSKILFSIVEFLGYAAVFVVSFFTGRGKEDWFSHPIFNWLGIFSYSLYLGHGFWSNSMVELFPELNYWTRIPVYLSISFATGLVIHFVSRGLRKLWKEKSQQIKRMFLKENEM